MGGPGPPPITKSDPITESGDRSRTSKSKLKRSPLCLEITAYIGKRFGFHFILFHRAPAYLDQSYRVFTFSHFID